MRAPRWISPTALVLLHGEAIAEHGGLSGIRDEASLDAALHRPKHVFAYRKNADLAALAAAYGFGIVRNHPFYDGNKRAGFLAIGVFLGINGYELEVDPVEAIAMIMSLAAGKTTEAELASWVRNHTRRAVRKR
jgi:death on curing protein